MKIGWEVVHQDDRPFLTRRLYDVNAVLISLHELLYEIHLFHRAYQTVFAVADQSKQPRRAIQLPTASFQNRERTSWLRD